MTRSTFKIYSQRVYSSSLWDGSSYKKNTNLNIYLVSVRLNSSMAFQCSWVETLKHRTTSRSYVTWLWPISCVPFPYKPAMLFFTFSFNIPFREDYLGQPPYSSPDQIRPPDAYVPRTPCPFSSKHWNNLL